MRREMFMIRAARLLLLVAVVWFVQAASPGPVMGALLLHYPMDGDTLDASGNGRDGIAGGGAGFVPGVFGQAISLGGTHSNQNVTWNNSSGALTTPSYTFSAHIYVAQHIGGDAMVAELRHSGTQGWAIHIWSPTQSKPQHLVPFTPPDSTISPSAILEGQWYHVAVTTESDSVGGAGGGFSRLYLDGVLVDDNPYPFDITPPAGPDFNVGGRAGDPSSYFRGWIDDVAVWDEVLSDSQILSLATNACCVAGPTPTEHEWSVDRGGDWNTGGNWTAGVPDGNDQTAIFGDRITTTRTVFTDQDVTIKTAQFVSAQSYVIAGGGSVNLAAGTPPTEVLVLLGDHQFQAVVNLNSDTNVTIAPDASLAFNNTLDLGGNTLTKLADGELAIRNTLITGGGTVDIQGGTVSGNGTIGGNLINNGGTTSPGDSLASLSVVPEPNTLLLLVVGMLPVWRRRRGI